MSDIPTVVYIYALRDPRTQVIRYVGSTNNLMKRHYAHVNQPHTSVNPWIKELRSIQLQPIIEVLEETDVDNRQVRESHWIAQFRLEGQLLNCLEVGGGYAGPEKTAIGCRLTPVALELLAGLARRSGINKSGMLEVIIRDRAKQEGLRS